MRALIGSGSTRLILCARGDETAFGVLPNVTSERATLALLARADRESITTLRRLLVSRFGMAVRRLDDRAVIAATARLIVTGRIVGLSVVAPPRAVAVDRLTVLDAQPPEAKPVTWIEIVLLDEADAPCPGERYRIVLPDESRVEGRLDRDGRARVDGIESPGTCVISFPDLDEGATCPIDVPPTAPGPAIAPPEPPKPSTTWLEIELLDDADGPVSGERYEVTFPDGTVRQGTLDSCGRARFDGVPLGGSCQVAFPDLDESAWEAL